jgi:hypothetical protein
MVWEARFFPFPVRPLGTKNRQSLAMRKPTTKCLVTRIGEKMKKQIVGFLLGCLFVATLFFGIGQVLAAQPTPAPLSLEVVGAVPGFNATLDFGAIAKVGLDPQTGESVYVAFDLQGKFLDFICPCESGWCKTTPPTGLTATPGVGPSATPLVLSSSTPSKPTSTPEPVNTTAPEPTAAANAKCNQGVGNGPEGCSPGKSDKNQPANDESQPQCGYPGHPCRGKN